MKTKNRTKKMFKIALVVFGVISLCFVLSTCIAVVLTSGEEVVVVEVTATPTVPLVVTTAYNATNEAKILATPAPTPYPTNTPAPTPTNIPEPTPTQKPESVSLYHVEMPKLVNRYAEAFSSIGSLTGQAGTDVTLLRDVGWMEDISQVLAEILVVGFEIRALEPPPPFEETHKLLIQASEHFDASVYLFADGVDNLDPLLIEQATEEMALGGNLVEQATEALPDSY